VEKSGILVGKIDRVSSLGAHHEGAGERRHESMTSMIYWLDFSDSDCRKMVEVISLFKQRNKVSLDIFWLKD